MPGRPTWPVISASAIRQRALSVPWTCWLMPMPQKMIEAFAWRRCARRRGSSRPATPQTGAIASGEKSLTLLLQRLEALGVALDVLLVVEPSVMMVCSIAFSSATSLPGLNCSMMVAWRDRAWPRGSITISLAPRLAAFLMKVAATGWLIGRIGADHDDDVGVHRGGERRRHRARADALHQRRDRRGVAQPRAVVDIVGAEAGAHQLLEQIGLLVRALGRAEAGERLRPMRVADLHQAGRRRAPAPLPRWPRGNASRDWRDRPRRRPIWARRPCGSAARSAGRDGGRSRSRSGP